MFKKIKKNNSGAVLIILVLIISIVVFGVSFSLAKNSLSGVIDTDKQIASWKARSNLFGCVDEVFLRLQSDPSFTTTSMNLLDFTCNVDINSPAPDNLQITASTTLSNITRSVFIDLDVDPINVNRLIER